MQDTLETGEDLGELEEGIDEETLQAIDSTVESDFDYNDYVTNEREERARKRAERRQAEIQKERKQREEEIEEYRQEKMDEIGTEPVPNPNLEEGRTGRVKKVQFVEESEKFAVTVETRDGSTFKQDISAALPENENSEWVRLCDYVGVEPRPSELRGEIVPIKTPVNPNEPDFSAIIPNLEELSTPPEVRISGPSQTQIDVPPVSGGLNPVAYKFHRAIGHRLRHSKKFRKVGEGVVFTSPWWVTAIFTPLLFIVFHSLISISGSAGSVGILLFPLILIDAILLSVFVSIGVIYWAFFGLAIIALSVLGSVKVGGKAYEYLMENLFPEE